MKQQCIAPRYLKGLFWAQSADRKGPLWSDCRTVEPNLRIIWWALSSLGNGEQGKVFPNLPPGVNYLQNTWRILSVGATHSSMVQCPLRLPCKVKARTESWEGKEKTNISSVMEGLSACLSSLTFICIPTVDDRIKGKWNHFLLRERGGAIQLWLLLCWSIFWGLCVAPKFACVETWFLDFKVLP